MIIISDERKIVQNRSETEQSKAEIGTTMVRSMGEWTARESDRDANQTMMLMKEN